MNKPTEQDSASVPSLQKNTDSPWTGYDILIREGNCNVLLIAPYGYPNNDKKTYEIGRLVAKELDCYAIVNKTYRKPPFKKKEDGTEYRDENGKKVRHDPDKTKKRIDLNRNNQVCDHLKSEFETPLQDIVKEITEKFGKALVLWIHGIDDDNLTDDNTEGNADGINALIGRGQGNPNRYTAYKKTVDEIVSALGANSISPLNAALAKSGSKYCGQHENIMNQFFKSKGHSLRKVESIQLEIGRIGFRKEGNFETTAKALAESFSKMAIRSDPKLEEATSDSAVQTGSAPQMETNGNTEKKPNGELVEVKNPEILDDNAKTPFDLTETTADQQLADEAFNWLQERFRDHIAAFALEAGQYIIEKFYNGDSYLAFAKNKSKKQPASLNLLIKKI